MLTIDEIMTADVATVEPQMSLRDALGVLRGEDVSGAPVVQGGEVVGVVSVTDVLELEATSPGVPTERRSQSEWGEFGSPDLWEEGDESPSAFFVDYWSNVGAEVTERFEKSDAPEWDVLEEHVVAEVMTRQVVALPPNADLREAARLMVEADVHRVLVIEGGQLHGIVTTTDVVRAVAQEKI